MQKIKKDVYVQSGLCRTILNYVNLILKIEILQCLQHT